MSEKKPDKRTLKTEKAICTALAELLTEKELHRITVQEIADKADINRVTFYKHYLDVYDLYEKMEKGIITDLGLIVLQGKTDPSCTKSIIDYIDENRGLFSMVFSPYSTGTLRDKIEKMINGAYLTLYREKYGIRKSNTEFEYLCHYHSSGCISVIEKWVRSGYNRSKEYIVKSISELDKNFTSFCDKKY